MLIKIYYVPLIGKVLRKLHGNRKSIPICSVLFARWEVVESRADRQAPLAKWFYVRVRVWPVGTSGILHFVLLWKNYILKTGNFIQLLASIMSF